MDTDTDTDPFPTQAQAFRSGNGPPGCRIRAALEVVHDWLFEETNVTFDTFEDYYWSLLWSFNFSDVIRLRRAVHDKDRMARLKEQYIRPHLEKKERWRQWHLDRKRNAELTKALLASVPKS